MIVKQIVSYSLGWAQAFMMVAFASAIALMIKAVQIPGVSPSGLEKSPMSGTGFLETSGEAGVPISIQTMYQYQEDFEYCTANNFVLSRGWLQGPEKNKTENQPYSVTDDTFASFHDRSVATVDELVHAIKFGQRRWRDPQYTHQEGHQSYFVPFLYDIPPVSSTRACAILGRYSHIFTVGESLTRHLRGAMFMLLRRDMVLGGIISTNKRGNAKLEHPYNCKCDGQFSEADVCRQNNGVFNSATPRDLDVCSHLSEAKSFRFSYDAKPAKPNWQGAKCEDPDARPVVLYFESGVHYNSDSNQTVRERVQPLIGDANFKTCVGHDKVRVIWSTYTAQSRTLDEHFPKQTRENAMIFNEEMAAYWARQPFDVTILDWWNLTADAQTSDGFHSLSDVNLVKATHLLNVMDLLSQK